MVKQELKEYTENAVTKGIRKTRELKFYLVKFAIRIVIVLIFLALYITNREGLVDMMMQPIWHGINFVNVIWVVFMVIMISHLIPNNRLSMAGRRQRKASTVLSKITIRWGLQNTFRSRMSQLLSSCLSGCRSMQYLESSTLQES